MIILRYTTPYKTDNLLPELINTFIEGIAQRGSGKILERDISVAGSDTNPALPDTSMKLGRCVHKHKLFETFSLDNENKSSFQGGGSKSKVAAKINIKSENEVLIREKKT